MLTENEVSRSWRKLFRGGNYNKEAFSRAEVLLEELRPESPLRHRLEAELAELKKLKPKRETCAP